MNFVTYFLKYSNNYRFFVPLATDLEHFFKTQLSGFGHNFQRQKSPLKTTTKQEVALTSILRGLIIMKISVLRKLPNTLNRVQNIFLQGELKL